MGSYVPSTQEQRQEMLQAIGLKDFRELYKESYLPFTFPEFTGEMPVAPVELRLSFGERDVP